MELTKKLKEMLYMEREQIEETNEMQEDFINFIEPLKRQLEIINSDLILGKINKEKELEMCKPILAKIEAFERKYELEA